MIQTAAEATTIHRNRPMFPSEREPIRIEPPPYYPSPSTVERGVIQTS
jgi:hypothetical protein